MVNLEIFAVYTHKHTQVAICWLVEECPDYQALFVSLEAPGAAGIKLYIHIAAATY